MNIDSVNSHLFDDGNVVYGLNALFLPQLRKQHKEDIFTERDFIFEGTRGTEFICPTNYKIEFGAPVRCWLEETEAEYEIKCKNWLLEHSATSVSMFSLCDAIDASRNTSTPIRTLGDLIRNLIKSHYEVNKTCHIHLVRSSYYDDIGIIICEFRLSVIRDFGAFNQELRRLKEKHNENKTKI